MKYYVIAEESNECWIAGEEDGKMRALRSWERVLYVAETWEDAANYRDKWIASQSESE